jgi:phage virion morphogenesis protein
MAAGVELTAELDARVLAEIDRVFARLGSAGVEQIADEVSMMMEDQTKRRIKTEKTAPDGTPWAPWSDRYALTRNTGNSTQHSLLINEENLLNSVQRYSTGDTASVASRTPYSAIHQFGGRGIPARPYLGLSDANRREIEELVIDRVEALLQ